MQTKQHYGAKEYFGDRPCVDPVVMQYLQLKLRPTTETTQKGKKK
jgi:hypothetical protein